MKTLKFTPSTHHVDVVSLSDFRAAVALQACIKQPLDLKRPILLVPDDYFLNVD